MKVIRLNAWFYAQDQMIGTYNYFVLSVCNFRYNFVR